MLTVSDEQDFEPPPPFQTVATQIEAAKLFEHIAHQINEAVYAVDIAIGDHPVTNARPQYREAENEAWGIESYRQGMADLKKAMQLLRAAEDRFNTMSIHIGLDGVIKDDWAWLYAKHGIEGQALEIESGYLGGAEYDGPNPLLLAIRKEPESAETREAISAIFKAHGFKLKSFHGKEWNGEDDPGWWLSVDRGPDTIASMDKAFRALGFAHVEWTGDDAHLLTSEISVANNPNDPPEIEGNAERLLAVIGLTPEDVREQRRDTLARMATLSGGTAKSICA